MLSAQGRRLGLSSSDSREHLLQALYQYRLDPLFCVPDRAREIFSRRGSLTTFVLLGSKDFTAVFIAAARMRVRILYVVDDFKHAKGESSFHGVEYITTARFLEIARTDPDLVALNCCRFDYSRRFFEHLCRTHGIPLLNHEQAFRLLDLSGVADHRVADWGPSIAARFEEFTALENRLADPYSVETLRAVLTFHLTADPEWHLNVARPYHSLYFRSGLFSLSATEKMVDCGASIGESTNALISITDGRFSRSWMIEPDKFNVETLSQLQRHHAGSDIGEKISLHPVALGDEESEVSFHHQGGHSGSIALNDPHATLEKVLLRPVDNIIDDIPTFIKMDIEGFEMAALRGSVKSIRAGLPKMAISAYHRSTDLIDITDYIDNIAPGYSVGLRHHTEDRWDTCLYFYR